MTLLIIHFAVLHELEAPLGMSHVLRFELCFREALGGFRRCLSWVPRPLRLLTSLRSAIHLAYRFCSAHIRPLEYASISLHPTGTEILLPCESGGRFFIETS